MWLTVSTPGEAPGRTEPPVTVPTIVPSPLTTPLAVLVRLPAPPLMFSVLEALTWTVPPLFINDDDSERKPDRSSSVPRLVVGVVSESVADDSGSIWPEPSLTVALLAV